MRYFAIFITKFSDLILNLSMVVFSLWVLSAKFGGSAWHQNILERFGPKQYEQFLQIGEWFSVLLFGISVFCAIVSDSILIKYSPEEEATKKFETIGSNPVVSSTPQRLPNPKKLNQYTRHYPSYRCKHLCSWRCRNRQQLY